jgi:hypothetical protein
MRNMAARRLLRIGAALLVLIVPGGLLLSFYLDRHASVRVLDGSILSVDAVHFGRSKVFLDGTGLEKILRPLLPTNGINLAGIRLRPPVEQKMSLQSGDALIVRLSLCARNNAQNALLPALWQKRGIVSLPSETGHRYVRYAEPWQRSRAAREWYTHVYFTAFPREQGRLALDVLDDAGNSVARLHFNNPLPKAAREERQAFRPMATNVNGLDVAFARVRFPASDARLQYGKLPCAILPVRIQDADRVLTNWGIRDMRMRDAMGNSLTITSWNSKSATNEWQEYAIWPYLDPAEPWLVEFQLTKDAGFEPHEVCALTFDYPLWAQRRKDFGEYTLDYRCPAGRTVVGLSVSLLPTNTMVQLSFVEAYDEAGKRLSLGHGLSLRHQHHFNRALEYQDTDQVGTQIAHGTKLTVVVAIHTNYLGSVVLPAEAR